jgi:hypothetical protein
VVACRGEDPEGSVASSMVEICVLRLPVALVETTGMERVPGSPGPANIFFQGGSKLASITSSGVFIGRVVVQRMRYLVISGRRDSRGDCSGPGITRASHYGERERVVNKMREYC